MSKDRKQIILQSLAKLLEERDATKVTTAVLAAESGVTEAALYRHFPSKRSIFLELFYILRSRQSSIKVGEIKKDSDIEAEEKGEINILFLMRSFLEKNKGFARILSREALRAKRTKCHRLRSISSTKGSSFQSSNCYRSKKDALAVDCRAKRAPSNHSDGGDDLKIYKE